MKKTTIAKADLLWLDMEMTGLDFERDRVLEVGAIATNWKLEEIARFTAAVRVSARLMKKRMQGEFWDENSEVRDRLLAQNSSGEPAKAVEENLIKFLNKYFDRKQPIIMAGNSIWNDRRFIEKYWPKLYKKLHYRMLDVTAWKLIFENKFGSKFTKPDAHHAIEDIEGSIAELKQYLVKVKK